jgi:NTE family protein
MTIKHLVLSGGGNTLFKQCGAIQVLEKNKFYDINEIESIYATSAGAIMAILLCLNFDWDTINSYLLDRPWHNVFSVNIKHFLNAYKSCGIYDITFFEIFFKSLFAAKDIKIDITLKEFYEFSKKDIHVYTVEANAFQLEDISHKTHPDLQLITALHMTCSIPLIFSPVFMNDKCYIDGGVINNYPLLYCLKRPNISNDEILGITNIYCDDKENTKILKNINAFDYVYKIILKLILGNILTIENSNYNEVKYEVLIKYSGLNIKGLYTSLTSSNERRLLFEDGIQSGIEFLKKNKQEKIISSLPSNVSDILREISELNKVCESNL